MSMVEIKDIVGLGKPLTRLIEVISSGVGAVSRSYLIKKNASARANEIRLISKALKDVSEQEQLQVIYKDGIIEIWKQPEDGSLATTTLPLRDKVCLRVDYQERKRQQNIENITSIAAANLIRDEDVPEQKPDEDWITRFFSSAQEISSGAMQDLWGRLLAGEIKRPGSYSLRTLEFIKNVTRHDALLFERIGKLAVSYGGYQFIAAHDKNWLKENREIYLGDHFDMSELGAMYPSELTCSIFMKDSLQKEILVSGNLVLIINRAELKGEIRIQRGGSL